MGGGPWTIVVVALAGAALLVFLARQSAKVPGPPGWICATCGTASDASRRAPGSFLFELALWVVALWYVGDRYAVILRLPADLQGAVSAHAGVLLIPLAYSIYRVASKRRKCPACGATTLVPYDSPVGRRLREAGQSGSASA